MSNFVERYVFNDKEFKFNNNINILYGNHNRGKTNLLRSMFWSGDLGLYTHNNNMMNVSLYSSLRTKESEFIYNVQVKPYFLQADKKQHKKKLLSYLGYILDSIVIYDNGAIHLDDRKVTFIDKQVIMLISTIFHHKLTNPKNDLMLIDDGLIYYSKVYQLKIMSVINKIYSSGQVIMTTNNKDHLKYDSSL